MKTVTKSAASETGGLTLTDTFESHASASDVTLRASFYSASLDAHVDVLVAAEVSHDVDGDPRVTFVSLRCDGDASLFAAAESAVRESADVESAVLTAYREQYEWPVVGRKVA
jgi:hypothetical protein